MKNRNQCDQDVKNTSGVAFFFSCVSTLTNKRRDDEQENPVEEDGDEEDSEEELANLTQLSQVNNALLTRV